VRSLRNQGHGTSGFSGFGGRAATTFADPAVFRSNDSVEAAQHAVERIVDPDATRRLQSALVTKHSRVEANMRDPITEGQLRRELDLVLVRLERRGRAALIEARSESVRLAGDVFVDAQVVSSQGLEELSYERLARRARMLANALDRVRDGSYGSCEECGRRIPEARRRALPGVTTCLPCQEVGERLHARSSEAAPMTRRRVRVKRWV
jgi:RNA polymerase-binding transcription factor